MGFFKKKLGNVFRRLVGKSGRESGPREGGVFELAALIVGEVERDRQARDVRRAGRAAIEETRRQARAAIDTEQRQLFRLLAAQNAAFGAAGVNPPGTPLFVAEESTEESLIQQELIKQQAFFEAEQIRREKKAATRALRAGSIAAFINFAASLSQAQRRGF